MSPDIFISYQHSKQVQVKALCKRLIDLGYTCWLDIEQMGGGNVLDEEIYTGITGCKVMLSCVTPAYAASQSCR